MLLAVIFNTFLEFSVIAYTVLTAILRPWIVAFPLPFSETGSARYGTGTPEFPFAPTPIFRLNWTREKLRAICFHGGLANAYSTTEYRRRICTASGFDFGCMAAGGRTGGPRRPVRPTTVDCTICHCQRNPCAGFTTVCWSRIVAIPLLAQTCIWGIFWSFLEAVIPRTPATPS